MYRRKLQHSRVKNLFKFASVKINRLIIVESALEFDASTDSEYSPDIVSFEVQPTLIWVLTGRMFNTKADLLILDEIGECSRAVTSLKYFAEKAPHMFVAACGSNIGLLNTFPVGKVEQHNLRPLTFREFLVASNESALIRAYENEVNTCKSGIRVFTRFW